jgi:hypothetical protein
MIHLRQKIIIISVLSTLIFNISIIKSYAESRYKYNSELSYDQALNIEPKDFYKNTNPNYIFKAIEKLIAYSNNDEKSLNRLFILLIHGDAGAAEIIALNLHRLMLKKQDYFFITLSKLDLKIQKRVLFDVISLPDNDFNIHNIKRSSNSEIIFLVYDEYKKHQK